MLCVLYKQQLRLPELSGKHRVHYSSLCCHPASCCCCCYHSVTVQDQTSCRLLPGCSYSSCIHNRHALVIVIYIVITIQDSTSSRLSPGSSYSCCIHNLHALLCTSGASSYTSQQHMQCLPNARQASVWGFFLDLGGASSKLK
jgi:hypothetical protein